MTVIHEGAVQFIEVLRDVRRLSIQRLPERVDSRIKRRRAANLCTQEVLADEDPLK